MAELRALEKDLAGRAATIDPSWVPRPDLGPCPVKAPDAVQIVRDPSVPSDPAMFLAGRARTAAGAIAASLQGGEYADREKVRQAMSPPVPDTVAVLLVDEWQDATFDAKTMANSYQGGWVSGRAYLWSAKANKVICVSDVEAKSSGSLQVMVSSSPDDPYNGSDVRVAIDKDLRDHVETTVQHSFKYAGGPPP